MAVSPKCSGYSRNGEYFAFCGADGKLKIWDTESSILKQEFTPNFHLVSPCSCLLWINFSRNPVNTDAQQRKKKRPKSLASEATYVALGTSVGEIYLYNHATASVDTQLRGGHSSANVNDLTWAPGTNLYSCANDGLIVEWSLSDFKVKSKWKGGTEKVLCILISPDGKWLFSGARAIHWWDAESHDLLHVFTGHTSPLLSFTFVPQVSSNGNTYLISTATGDRYMNIWTLSKKAGKNAAVSLVLNNEPTGHVLIRTCMDGPSIVGAVTQSGDLEIFKHELNGICPKPLKAALQLQVASDSEDNVESIPILAACYLPDLKLKIAYGNTVFLSFDSVVPSTAEKLQVIVRKDPRQPLRATKKEALTKVRETKTDASVEYHLNAASASSVKRKLGSTRNLEAAMEERLENLSIGLARSEEKDPVPRAHRTSHLLAQALAANDQNMLNSALSSRDEGVITKTVERLSIQNVADLLKTLVSLIQGKTATSLMATRWLKVVLTIHASYLMSNPDLIDMVAPLLEVVQTRLSLLPVLGNLKGRLDMLNAQLSSATESATGTPALQQGLLVYQDVDTSEDEGESRLDFVGGSESDEKWEELSDTEDENEEDEAENENEGEEDDDDDEEDDNEDDGGRGDMDVDDSS